MSSFGEFQLVWYFCPKLLGERNAEALVLRQANIRKKTPKGPSKSWRYNWNRVLGHDAVRLYMDNYSIGYTITGKYSDPETT